jgi:hypothetical protein
MPISIAIIGSMASSFAVSMLIFGVIWASAQMRSKTDSVFSHLVKESAVKLFGSIDRRTRII